METTFDTLPTIEIIPFYSQHLRNDKVKGAKEYQLWELNEIVGLIAKVKDRIKGIKDHCEIMWGKNEDGKIRGTDKDVADLAHYRNVILRLQSYYNFKLNKLSRYA